MGRLLPDSLHALVSAMPDGVVGVDQRGRIELVNPAAERLLGRQASQLLGVPLEQLVAEQPTHGPVLRQLLASPAGEAVVLPIHGRERQLAVEVTAFPYGDGRTGVVLRDVGGALAAEGDTEAFRRRLAQVARIDALSSLGAGIASDFNNALTVIASVARGLLESPAEGVRGELQAILKEADRAAELVRRLLALGPAHRAEEVDPALSMADLAAICRATSPRDVAVEVDVQPVSTIRTDDCLFSQALLNLVTNAQQAMRGGGGRLSLKLFERTTAEATVCTTRTVPPGRWVVAEVKDTGVGMEPDVMARMFEPFFTTRPAGVGTGLGLAMVFSLVHRAHGAVDVVSSPGQGTTVSLYFPAGSQPPLRAPLRADGRLRVLWVAPEGLGAVAVRRGLMQMGHSCHAVGGPAEALTLLGADPAAFDALLIDGSGAAGLAELPRQARSLSPTVQVVVVAAEGTPPPLKSHADVVLLAPATAQDVHHALLHPADARKAG